MQSNVSSKQNYTLCVLVFIVMFLVLVISTSQSLRNFIADEAAGYHQSAVEM